MVYKLWNSIFYVLKILIDQSEIGKNVLMSLKKVQNSHFAECRYNECCALDKSLCTKGQLISKGHLFFSILPKNERNISAPVD